MKSLYSNSEIIIIFEKLWERRAEVFRQFLVLSGLWTGVLFVLLYMWVVTGGAMSGWTALWIHLTGEVALALSAWIQIRAIDRKANDILESSELFRDMLE